MERCHRQLILFVVMVFSGCTVLKLQNVPRVQPSDWNMYGGDIGRVNVAKEVVAPPLTVAWEYDGSAGFGPYSIAAVDSLLFVGNLKGEVHVVRVSDGRGFGDRDFGSAIVGTPILDDEMMYIVLAHDEESVQSYDLHNATFPWRTRLGDIETSPLFLGRKLYITTLDGKLHCLDKGDGAILWTFEIPENTRTRIIHSSPASDGNVIVFGCDNGRVYAVDAKDGKLRWTAMTRASVLASPSVRNGMVFVGSLDSTMYAFDVETGALRWAQSLGSKIFSSQAVDQQHVFVGTIGRFIYCLDAATGSIVWRRPTNGGINAAPLISGNTMYIGCIDKSFYGLDKETGEILWQYTAEGRVKTMPVIAKNYLLLLSEDRSVIALKHKNLR